MGADRPDTPLGRDYELLEITLRDESKDLARELRSRGLNVTANKLVKLVEDYALNAINDLAESFAEVARKHVPTDVEHINRGLLPFELQVDHIHVDFAQPGSYSAHVYVDTDDHYGARRRKPIEAAGLAMFLNDNPQGRSMGGGSSLNWVTDAQIEWNSVRKLALKKAGLR